MMTSNALNDYGRKLLTERYVHTDYFTGTKDELCSAGLARPDQFPGEPGMPKVNATFFMADGVRVPEGRNARTYEPTKVIRRIGGARFRLTIHLSDQEERRRRELVGRGGDVPLDLPGPAAPEPSTPDWAPAGWALRAYRECNSDFVFAVTQEQLEASGMLTGARQVSEAGQRQSSSFVTNRFGWVRVARRDERLLYVVCYAPSEVRCAAYRVNDCVHTIYHTGTKQQLQSKGLAVGCGFPGEPGCNPRKLTVVDPRSGSRTQIALLPRYQWCGDTPRFELTIKRSEAEQKAIRAKQDKVKEEKLHVDFLKGLAGSPEAFRDEVANLMWHYASIIKHAMTPAHGYRFSDEVVTEFMDGATDAFWALKNGATTGRSPGKALADTARNDAALQAFLAPFREAH